MFKPQAMNKIANSLGYNDADLSGFDAYLQANPEKMKQMDSYKQKAVHMAQGGFVQKMADGGSVNPVLGNVAPSYQNYDTSGDMTDLSTQMITAPGLPQGGAVTPQGTNTNTDQFVDPATGQIGSMTSVPTAMATTSTADTSGLTGQTASTMTATQSSDDVNTALAATQAAQGTVDPRAEVLAASQTASSVENVTAAQGQNIVMNNPVQRQIENGELVSGAANATTAAAFTEQVQAATATPTEQATVQGQLEDLMADFDGGATPPWAAGALRSATSAMAARGLGASSMAGQALIQAAMESAIPIAATDAATFAKFEQQNLSNKQQRAMLAAEQRAAFMGQEFTQEFQARVANASKISEVANMNFTAEQQVALENSRNANSINMANLTNQQAVVMAEAAALAQMDAQNLNNRQQAAVQNAQNFMQMDMANLNNEQQTALFKSQQAIQALFTDQAAENAAAQFNATSENQTNQFFSNLKTSTDQFNATQSNAQAQFNAGQANVVERFNAEIANQRDQFNAQNQIVISQANAQWRRQIATQDTAAINRANEVNALNTLQISNQAYDNMWTQYRDIVEFSWRSGESTLDREATLAQARLTADSNADVADSQNSSAAGSAIGGLIGTLGAAYISTL